MGQCSCKAAASRWPPIHPEPNNSPESPEFSVVFDEAQLTTDNRLQGITEAIDASPNSQLSTKQGSPMNCAANPQHLNRLGNKPEHSELRGFYKKLFFPSLPDSRPEPGINTT